MKAYKYRLFNVLCWLWNIDEGAGSKNENKFGEINILDSNFLSSSYGNESHKSVGYGKYTTLNMVLFLQLIGWKQKEVGGSWAK